MSGGITLCFYFVIGAGVAVAVWISESSLVQSDRLFRVCTALLFWPLYLPVLLISNGSTPPDDGMRSAVSHNQPSPDQMAIAIAQVESELDSALQSLNGWAETTLSAQADRFAELRSAWRQQAARVRELDGLLSTITIGAATSDPSIRDASAIEADSLSARRITTSEQARRENLAKLKRVRQQCHDDLMATLASVRQLVTMIHLARYTGAPASRAAELIQQIADAVDGLPRPTA